MWGVFPPQEKQRKTDRVQICRNLTPSRSYLCPIPGHLAPTQPVDHPDWIWALPGPEARFLHSEKKNKSTKMQHLTCFDLKVRRVIQLWRRGQRCLRNPQVQNIPSGGGGGVKKLPCLRNVVILNYSPLCSIGLSQCS